METDRAISDDRKPNFAAALSDVMNDAGDHPGGAVAETALETIEDAEGSVPHKDAARLNDG